jgi:beta-carotene 15,15'-dioxygenase
MAYLAAAALVVVLWCFTPGFFLAAFLLVSVLHFSGDPDGETPVMFRTLYGGAVILCPLTIYDADVTQLFALLAGLPAAQAIVAALQWATWPWIAAIGLAAIAGLKREPARSVELLSIAALLTFLPPLIGFTIFFCGMHSARHMLRTRDYSGARTLRHLLRISVWPMLATVAGVGITWWLYDGEPFDMRLAQLLFVGLAALTVPHMVVVERVRFTGWVLGRNTAQETVFHGATHD